MLYSLMSLPRMSSGTHKPYMHACMFMSVSVDNHFVLFFIFNVLYILSMLKPLCVEFFYVIFQIIRMI